MAWLLVLGAGILEIVWAIALKCSSGFTKPVPIIITIVALIGSMLLLGLSLRWLAISTTYAVWTGIGAAGTAAIGMTYFNEPVSAGRIIFLILIIIGVVGLQLVSITT